MLLHLLESIMYASTDNHICIGEEEGEYNLLII